METNKKKTIIRKKEKIILKISGPETMTFQS
jgi:hypothetical protein